MQHFLALMDHSTMKRFFPILCSWFLCLFFGDIHRAVGQCSPPMSEICDGTPVQCALNELNGLACASTSTLASICSPICSQGGSAENTSWWGFVGNGGSASITLSVGTCTSSQGLEFGILSNCKCSQSLACKSVPCVAPGSSFTLTAGFQKCVAYYLWVDGCDGDICDFTISTSGGGPPLPDPLDFINNDPDGVIDACEGYCSYDFYVVGSDECFIQYEWTLDGTTLGNSEKHLYLDLPNEGDFQLCVTAQLLNPADFNMVCSQVGPRCATIRVRKQPDRLGKNRKICKETNNPVGYKWFSHYISTSGEYRQTLADAHCCKFDSVVYFQVVEVGTPANVFFIGCGNQYYTDILGRKHGPCTFQKEVVLPKSSAPYHCDSSIVLTAIQVEYTPSWAALCLGNEVELVPNINIQKPCNAGETYRFEYRWYKKNDLKNIVGSNERLLVPAVKEDYVLEVDVVTILSDEEKICTQVFYETFDESDVIPDCLPIKGSKVYCFDPVGTYRMDGVISKPVDFYTWRVDKGQITSNPDSSSVKVAWSLGMGDTGRICASYHVDCGMSCEQCMDVVLEYNIAGQHFSQRGLTAYLDAKAHAGGNWRLISGPSGVHLFEPLNPKSKVSAYTYGLYCFEWTISNGNCLVRDTLCVDFYFAQRASPEYPRNDFGRGFRKSGEGDFSNAFSATSQNIARTAATFLVNVLGDCDQHVQFSWVDVYGYTHTQLTRTCANNTESYEIETPVHQGIYFLVVQSGNAVEMHRICVVN